MRTTIRMEFLLLMIELGRGFVIFQILSIVAGNLILSRIQFRIEAMT